MKRRSFLQAIGGAVAALFVPKVAAKSDDLHLRSADIWVDSGNRRRDYFLRERGTVGNPYRTIQEAIDAAKPGDTVMVKPAHLEIIADPVQMKNGLTIVGHHKYRTKITWPAP